MVASSRPPHRQRDEVVQRSLGRREERIGGSASEPAAGTLLQASDEGVLLPGQGLALLLDSDGASPAILSWFAGSSLTHVLSPCLGPKKHLRGASSVLEVPFLQHRSGGEMADTYV